jgi:Cu/Ag efflux protein CusF
LKRVVILLALMVVVPVAGCRRFWARHDRSGAQQHMGTGAVESIASDRKTIQINHEDIKDYMPAMSMTFRVRRPEILDSINPGDTVDFTLRDTGSGYVLTAIKKH